MSTDDPSVSAPAGRQERTEIPYLLSAPNPFWRSAASTQRNARQQTQHPHRHVRTPGAAGRSSAFWPPARLLRRTTGAPLPAPRRKRPWLWVDICREGPLESRSGIRRKQKQGSSSGNSRGNSRRLVGGVFGPLSLHLLVRADFLLDPTGFSFPLVTRTYGPSVVYVEMYRYVVTDRHDVSRRHPIPTDSPPRSTV